MAQGEWLKKMAAMAKSGKYPSPKVYAPHVHYIRDEYRMAYRVWPCWHPGDSFYMIPIAEFDAAIGIIKAMSFFHKGSPEDDDGTLSCPICKHNETLND